MILSYSGDFPAFDLDSVKQAAQLLMEDFPKDPSTENLSADILFSPSETTLTVKKKGDHCTIVCREPAHYFRGLNYLLHHLQEDFEIRETPCFKKNGFMLDCSRNAVATPDTVKKLIKLLAKTGMNQLFLYTEDTYEVPGLPYFGTYRGRYSQKELKELDAYAWQFGIELVPCIQTLAHLRNFLKWPEAAPLKDTADILKTGSDQVYGFIRLLLTALKDCFRSRNIHIGMDEAVFLGLGNYLKEHGYRESSVLIREHSTRVLEICRELGWDPMMWSDMYITSNTKNGYYAIDQNTSTQSWEKPQPGLGLVYWDYYNWDQQVYRNMLRVHKELSQRTIFAGGVWNWNGISPNYGKAMVCTKAALKECQAQGIEEVFATGWMDNGAETPLDAVYPGLIAFAHLCFHPDFTQKELSQAFQDCTDGSLEDFLLLDDFDALFQGSGNNLSTDNPSKYLLYQDPMLGLFDYHIQDVDTETYYFSLAEKLRKARDRSPKYRKLFDYYQALALVLSQKADLGIRLKSAYDLKDLSTLEKIGEELIPSILKNLGDMHRMREGLWMEDAKPFGYELLDIKLSGVSARLKACRRRISGYVTGEFPSLEELEQPRLPYWNVERQYPHDQKQDMRENLWNRIVSGCDLIDTI